MSGAEGGPRCPHCNAGINVYQRYCGSCRRLITWKAPPGQEPKCVKCGSHVDVYQERCTKCGQVLHWPAEKREAGAEAKVSKPLNEIPSRELGMVPEGKATRRKGRWPIRNYVLFLLAIAVITWLVAAALLPKGEKDEGSVVKTLER